MDASSEKLEAQLEELNQAAACLEDEAAVARLSARLLSERFPEALVHAYTTRGFPARGVGASSTFLGGAGLAESPGCRSAMIELLSVVRRSTRQGREWVETIHDGLVSADWMRLLFERLPARRGLGIREWCFATTALALEPLGGVSLFLPETARDPREREAMRRLAERSLPPIRMAALLSSSGPALHGLEHLLSSRADTAFLVSAAGQIVGASPLAERALMKDPGLAEALGRRVRRGLRRSEQVLLGRGAIAQIDPCSARGGASAFLATLGPAPREAGRGRLSARQAELVARLAEGLSNHDIAKAMRLAPSTVKTMLERLYRRANVTGRVALLRWAEGLPPAPAAGARD